jgi:hypothetical protein
MKTFIKNHGIATSLLIIFFCALSYFAYFNEYSEGGGDNAYHYFFSRYAFLYPKFFLEHWAKPLFVLLSSPFSQFGIYGTTIFNIIIGLSSAFITYKFAKAIGLKFSWLSIIILLSLPSYFFILQSAMTEPLMSFIVILSCYLLYQEKYFPAAIIMSFSLFSRSEGMFLTFYVLIYLSLIKQWKYIPLLTVGFFIYAFIGLFTGRDFFWYFTENPYGVISQYGHGEWIHFFSKYDYMWGLPQTIALSLGLLIIISLSIFKIKKLNFQLLIPEHKFLILVVIPAIIFFAFHVIVWKYGWCASYGLERVMNCIAPLVALIILYALNYLISTKLPNYISLIFISAFLYYSFIATFKFVTYPSKAYAGDKILFEASKWFKNNCNPNSTIYYSHPTLILDLDRNIFDTIKNPILSNLNLNDTIVSSTPTYVFWDSQFSELAHLMKLETLQNSKSLKLIYHPKEDYGFNLYVFETIH